MEDISIDGSRNVYFVPTVKFNAKDGNCELSGESFLEETEDFYAPLLQWLRDFTEHVKIPITFNYKLTYFNTSSSRCILDMLKILKKYEKEGGEVAVNWYYDEDDLDMEEALEDYIIATGLKINLCPT